MGTRTGYAPGTFCWVDLATSDPEAAKGFYTALLGWEYEDMSTGDGVYSIARLGGADVCALSAQRAEDPAPPHWNNYVSVDDADASAARAAELGGSVLMPGFDVMEAGRMAVVQDPTGGVLAVWQPRNHFGAARVNEPGCLTWNELGTKDVDAAASFYADLFGWGAEAMETGGGPAYTVIKVGERSNGGIREQSPQERDVPANWMPYFAVESADDTASKATGLGGGVLAGPIDLAMGRIAALQDPQGAVFALWEGPLED